MSSTEMALLATAGSVMAKHDIRGIIGGGAAPGGANEKVVHAFREARARAGREGEPGEGLCIGFSFHIADSVEQGIKEATPFFEENIKMFAPLGFVPGLTTEQIDAVVAEDRPHVVKVVGGGRGNRVELTITTKGRKQIEKLTPAWKSAQSAVVKTLGEKRWSAILSDLETAALALNN